MFPSAQSALFALGQLARRHGDRTAAIEIIDRMLALPSSAVGRPDPWWKYSRGVEQDDEAMLLEMWSVFPDKVWR
jgi:hypothetical protein